jgi:hypothetical protein
VEVEATATLGIAATLLVAALVKVVVATFEVAANFFEATLG